MAKLLTLELENFQSVERSTRIDFSPVTLLYGPNSAGKSAVYDALELIETVWNPKLVDSSRVQKLVDRWARRATEKDSDSERWLRLAVEFELEAIDPADANFSREEWEKSPVHQAGPLSFGNEDFIYALSQLGKTVRLDIKLMTKNYLEKEKNLTRIVSVSASIGGHLIVDCSKTNPLEMDSKYSNLREQIYIALFESPFFYLFHIKGTIGALKTEAGSGFFTPSEMSGASPTEIDTYLEDDPPTEMTIESKKLIADTARDIFIYLGGQITKILASSPPLVKADRRVPTPAEAMTVVNLNFPDAWVDNSAFSPGALSRQIANSHEGIDPLFNSIARAAHADLLLNIVKNEESSLNEDWAKKTAVLESESSRLAAINRHLSESLYIEKLYQVKCASTLLLPLDQKNYDSDSTYTSFYVLSQSAAVSLYLIDGEQQKVDLQDVGSGISFVLPVLAAATLNGVVRIQQPELHLHPALQSSLADIFIERVTDPKCQMIIETHSEHFLLRLLRRIRATGRGMNSSQKMTPSDIAIYYFDPQVSGGTIVSRQLVTPLGDFYTDWPRGFFAERDDDLRDV